MKKIIYIVTSLLVLCLYSCSYDNYDEPKSVLMGKVTCNGEPVQVRGSGEKV
ncbi:MAG: hypothetical protein LBU37_07040 [Tannerellaceae bacterium]|jgi:hypothetical protein|nr:hypothetical protein [Tannerellaceae bacterium]